jgi:hypothetical protein
MVGVAKERSSIATSLIFVQIFEGGKDLKCKYIIILKFLLACWNTGFGKS